MLEITRVKWRNFQSYGDYETVIDDLDKLGPTLISGSIEEGDSNGAGKSTIPTAILWCLTGRTFSKARPGDSVANFYNELECYVEVRIKDGWTIKRTRRSEGAADLLVYDESGNDESRSTNEAAQIFINSKYNLDYEVLVSSMFFGQLSKSFLESSDTVRKSILERLLGIDRINAWAEAAKIKLKTIESKQETLRNSITLLKSNIDKHNGFILDNNEKAQQHDLKVKALYAQVDSDILDYTAKMNEWDKKKEEYTKYQTQYKKLDALKDALIKMKKELAESEVKYSKLLLQKGSNDVNIKSGESRLANLLAVDVEAAKVEIESYKAANEKLEVAKEELIKLERASNKLNVELNHNREIITKYEEMAGSKCPACEQTIDGLHSDNLCDPYRVKLNDLQEKADIINGQISDKKQIIDDIEVVEPSMSESELKRISKDIETVQGEIEKLKTSNVGIENLITDLKTKIETQGVKVEKIEKGIEENTPAISLMDVITEIKAAESNAATLERLKKSKEEKRDNTNPYLQVIKNYMESIKKDEAEIVINESSLSAMGEQAAHYQYLYKSYSDRSKIKRLILSKMVPMLNERVKYYLECFKCDINFAFKDNLSIESNLWGYDNCSGGERKRIDLSVMFGLHDLYLGIYGRQCNVMVLDEVDGRLDTTGIEALIEIINNDFSGEKTERSKPGTIFVISHRPEMDEAFPSKIYVKRGKDRLSRIEEIK